MSDFPDKWEFRRDGYIYSAVTGHRVCSPHSTLLESEKVSAHIKDVRKNGHLIAAAPDLLTQLVRITDEYASAMKNAGVTHYPEALAIVREARAAIEKAEGKS